MKALFPGSSLFAMATDDEVATILFISLVLPCNEVRGVYWIRRVRESACPDYVQTIFSEPLNLL